MFKLDIVTSAPIPWTDFRLLRTPTVHIGSPSQLAVAAQLLSRGLHSDRAFVLLVQAYLFDTSRTVPRAARSLAILGSNLLVSWRMRKG